MRKNYLSINSVSFLSIDSHLLPLLSNFYMHFIVHEHTAFVKNKYKEKNSHKSLAQANRLINI